MSGAASPFFSIVMPVYNGGPVFATCLEALGDSSWKDWELIVVDDGSDDGSAELARRFGATVLSTPGRIGPGGARNLGAREARGEFLLFIDADCEVLDDTLENAAAALQADPSLDALFGSYDDAPAAPGWVSQYKNLQHHYVHQHGLEEASTFWAGCGAFRRTKFLELGGFDTASYPRPSIEDIELGYRLREAGGRIRLAKNVQVKHHKVWRLAGLIKTDIFDRGVPWTVLSLRKKFLVSDLNLDTRGRASVLLALVLGAALVAAPFEPRSLWVAAVAAAMLVALNQTFYRFYHRKRGLLFTLVAVPLHWLYFAYCALAFALGHLKHWSSTRGAPSGGPTG